MAPTVPKYFLMGNLTVIDEVHNDFHNLFIVKIKSWRGAFILIRLFTRYIPDGWYNTINLIDNITLKLWSERLV